MTTKNSTYHLFTSGGCLSQEGTILYLEHQLSGRERSLVREHLSTCNFCREALDGLQQVDTPEQLQPVFSELKTKLREEIRESQHPAFPRRRQLFDRVYYFSAAASILVLIGVLFLLDRENNSFPFEGNNSNEVLIAEKPVPPMPQAWASIPPSSEALDSGPSNHLNQRNETIEGGQKERTPENKSPGIPNELRTTDKRLESYLAETDEKTITKNENTIAQRMDLAATIPVEYFLSEITVQGRNQTINFIDPIENRSDVRDEFMQETGLDTEEITALSNHFFNPVESMPEFPGGIEGLNTYLAERLTYPKYAREHKIKGRVILSFLIDSYGTIRDIKVVRGIGGGCDQEAIRVIRQMPAWKPAYQNGQPVSVQFTLPINFQMI